MTGEIVLRTPAGAFTRVGVPDGTSPTHFWGAVSTFDSEYRRLGRLPSVDELCVISAGRIAKKSWQKLLVTEQFKQALSVRGIDLDATAGLSMEQQHVLLKLSDPYDRRALTSKLKELGVPMPTFQAWLKQKLFWEAYNEGSIAAYREALPAVRNRLISEAEAGDIQAIKLLFEKTGEHVPGAKDLEDAQSVILTLVEAIAKHVPLELRKAIMADVGLAQAARLALETGK
jgi:hypothetical protein